MDRGSHDYGAPGWPQGPSDPVYQRHAAPSRYDGYFGEQYDNVGVEDSWRSSHASDSWRDDRFGRSGDAPTHFKDQPLNQEYYGWRRSVSPERQRTFAPDRFKYVRPESNKPIRSEGRPRVRGRGRHRPVADQLPRAKDTVKARSDATDSLGKAREKPEGDMLKDSEEDIEKKSNIDAEEKNSDNTTVQKEESCEKQQTDSGLKESKEELSDEKPTEDNSSEKKEKKAANGSNNQEDPAKKIIIRKDFTHDDIHHFKPIAIRDFDDKAKLKRHRESGWVSQWEMKNATLKEGASRLGSDSKPAGSPVGQDGQRMRRESAHEVDDKQLPKANPILRGPVLDPQEYVEELSNPDLIDPPKVEDLASELLPKRKKAFNNAEEDWRGGAKTTLLGPPPIEGRKGLRGMPPDPPEIHRPFKPGLLGRPPPNAHYDEPGLRRPPKPGLLDGPRREPTGMRPHPYEEEYGPPPNHRRNGPASATRGIESIAGSAVAMAAASLSGPEVISEVAKKGIAELLMSNESIKAKIAEVYSEELKKLLGKGSKGEGGAPLLRAPERGFSDVPSGPRAGKALLGAPPVRRPDEPPRHQEMPPVNGPVGRFDEGPRPKYRNGSSQRGDVAPEGRWREGYDRPRSGALFDVPSASYREGPSQGWHDAPSNGESRDYRAPYPIERERRPQPASTWDDFGPSDRGRFREWEHERRGPRDFDDYSGPPGRSVPSRDPYAPVGDSRHGYGLNDRLEDPSWEYGESTFAPAGRGVFDSPRGPYIEHHRRM